MRLPAFVCLSVCLLARLLKNACMDLDEMLRVDRRRDMDELINFWAGSGYSPDAGTRLLSPLSYKRSYAEFYSLTHSLVDLPRWGLATAEFYVRKIQRICIGRCSDAWFYNSFIHRASEPLEHLCRRYMRSTECPSSLWCSIYRHAGLREAQPCRHCFLSFINLMKANNLISQVSGVPQSALSIDLHSLWCY